MIDYLALGNINLLFAGIIALPIIIYKFFKIRLSDDCLLIQICSVIQIIHVGLSFACLLTGFIISEFRLKVIALNSQIELRPLYKIAALWSNHEGSMMLWIFISALCHLVFLTQTRRRFNIIYQTASLIQFFIISFLCLNLYFTTNPFELLPNKMLQGFGLNPLLHDPAMLIHPPGLYFGFIGFTVPFAIAGGIIFHQLSLYQRECLILLRTWILGAFALLTAGITLGSIWAYYELGWGGYWYWDPVETLSILPWLIGLIIIHQFNKPQNDLNQSLSIPLMTVFLYCFVLWGTYLSRSGIVASVHAFAYDPYNGIVFLGLGTCCALFMISSIIRYKNSLTFKLNFSIRLTNLMNWKTTLVIFYCLILSLSLVIPGLLSVMDQQNIVIHPIFHIILSLIIASALSAMMTLIQHGSHYKKLSDTLSKVNIVTLTILIGVAIVSVIMDRIVTGLMGVILVIAVLIILRSMHQLMLRKWEVGIGHLSFALLLSGISINYLFGYQCEVVLSINKPYQFQNCSLTLNSISYDQTKLYKREQAHLKLVLSRPLLGQKGNLLQPEKRLYQANDMLTSKTALYQFGLSHYYVALGGAYPDGKRAIFFGYFPMVSLIWIGGFMLSLLALGKAIYLFRRY